jgi:hypothetical protein
MAVTPNSIVTTQGFQLSTPVQFANADGAAGLGMATNPSNTKQLATGKTGNGSVVTGLRISTDEASTIRNMNFYRSPDGGTTKYYMGTVSVPLQAGNTSAIPNVDALNVTSLVGLKLDASGRQTIPLPPGWTLHCGLQVAVTSGKFVNVDVDVEDF